MKKILHIGLLVAVVIMFAGCSDKTNCSGYPDKYVKWIPFKKGDLFTYSDGKNTFSLNVDFMHKTNAYTLKQPGISHNLCEVEAYAGLTGDSHLQQVKYGSVLPEPDPRGNYNVDTSMVYFLIELLTDEWSSFRFSISYGQFITPNPILSSFDNGFNEYSNVLRLENDTIKDQSPVWQIYLAESVGIIQFSDRSSHKTWSLVSRQ